MKKLLLFLLLVATNPAFLFAQQQGGSLEGKVSDMTGKGLPLANITLPDLGRGTTSDTSGFFKIQGIPPGKHSVTFTSLGYQRITKELQIKKGENIHWNIELKEGGIELKTLSVTSGSKAKSDFRNPTQVEVLSGQLKTESIQASLGATLARTEGVDNISTGGQSGKPVIRGLSGNRIRILHNGVPMDYQQFGVRHMPNSDPYLTERMEILQGPASILYGSDAIGGVINMIHPSIPEARGKNPFLNGEVLLGYHTNNQLFSSGAKISTAKGKWGLNAGVNFRQADNFHTPEVPTYLETGKEGDPKFTGELDHTDFDQLNGTIGTGYTGDLFQFSARYTHWKNEHNYLLPSGEGLGQKLANNIGQVKGKIFLNDTWSIQPSFTYLSNSRKSNPAGKTRDKIPEDDFAHLDLLLETTTSRVVAKHQKIGPITGQVGLEHQYFDQSTRGTGEPLLPNSYIHNYAIFLLEEARWGNLDLSMGLRYDHREQKATPNAELNLPDTAQGESREALTQQYDVFSGSFGANYALTEKFAVAATIARGFRAPNIFDLHADGIHGGVAAYQKGNPDLEPETSLNTDLTLKWESQNLRVKATGYRNEIQNYIYQKNIGFPEGWTGPPIMVMDQTNALLKGINAHISLNLLKKIRIKAGYETLQGTNRETGQALPLLPSSKLNGTIRYVFEPIGKMTNGFIKVGMKHAFAKEAAGRHEPFWQFENLPQFEFGVASTEPYTLFEAGIGIDLKLWNKPISLIIEGKNLLDTPYRDFLDTYKGYALGMGRNITFKVKVPF